MALDFGTRFFEVEQFSSNSVIINRLTKQPHCISIAYTIGSVRLLINIIFRFII